MRWYVVLTLISVYLLFIAAGPVLAQMMDSGQQMMGGMGKASDMMEQGKGMRAGQGMHGMGFMHSAGNAYGEYVTFTIDNQTGNVLNYGIAGTALFNISIANFNYKSTSTRGSQTWVSNTDGSTLIKLHDNPAAVINILTKKSISITFTLADGVIAAKEGDLIRIDSGSIVGYIAGTGAVTSSISGNQVKVDAPPDSAVIFHAAPINIPVLDHMYRRFSEEIARNRVGLDIALGRNGTYSAVNYSSGMQMGVQAMERDHIRLVINSTEPGGRIIAINLDNTTLIVGARERLRINYDGQPMQCVDDPDAVLNETDRPLCWISQEREIAQIMMYIPKFSDHTIDILVGPETTPAETMPEGKIVTLDDNGKTITLQVNETFLLNLGEFYDWNITIDDQTVVSRVVNVLVVKGAQGLYRAHKPGSATLTAAGDPTCRKSTPPCAAPSILFKLNIVVTGGTTAMPTATPGVTPTATPRTPAFEALLAVSALLAALLVRRR